jgi:hypothetical protein
MKEIAIPNKIIRWQFPLWVHSVAIGNRASQQKFTDDGQPLLGTARPVKAGHSPEIGGVIRAWISHYPCGVVRTRRARGNQQR